MGLGKLKMTKIQDDSHAVDYLDYSESKTKTDGNYKIVIYEKGRKRENVFGYYSNGIPTNEGFSFVVLKDSVTLKQY